MKKVLVILFGLFILAPVVNAATAEYGICAGKNITGEGYCTLDQGVYISGGSFKYKYNYFTNGKLAAANDYKGTVNGKTQHMFCIDPNLSSPNGKTFMYARGLNYNSPFDKNIARVYVSLVNAAVYRYNNNECSNLDECFEPYLQATNVLYRAFIKEAGYSANGGNSNALANYDNVVKQLKGLQVNGVRLDDKRANNQFGTIKKWYDTAKSSSGIGRTFRITAELKQDEEIVTEENGTTFTKTIPIKISGLNKFKIDGTTWDKTNPFVKITGLECSEGLTCELDTAKSNVNVNDNLLKKTSEDEMTVYVKVTGNSQVLKKNNKGKVTLKIEKYHVLDVDNLAIVRYKIDGTGGYQRMALLMPTTPQKVQIEINLDLPKYCRTETDDSGNKTYKLGTEEVSISDYINEGCCADIDTSDLSDADRDAFEEKCGGEDIVDLKQECGAGSCEGNNGTLPAKNVDSYVKQVSMKGTMDKVYKWENSESVNTETYAQQTKENLKYWRDDEFASELESNPYCKIYTSEENHMYYPTTTTATSGRFFVFGKGEDGQYLQPYVDGKIYSTFHTAFELWQKDYIKAIKTEKSKYTEWQQAANIQDAIDDAIKNGKETTCEHTYTVPCPEGVKGPCTEKEEITTMYYEGETQDTYYYGTYSGKDANGKYIPGVSRSWYSNSKCDEYTGVPEDPQVSSKQSAYTTAYNARKNLENQKTQCQDASKKYQSDWKYILEPDLTFHYNQKYYDSVSGQSKFLTTDIDMVISDQAEKYFPNVSTRVTNPTATSGGWDGVDFNQADGAEYEGALYGGSNHLGPRVEDPYEDVDKTDNEHHNYTRDFEDIKLYYRPDKAYYSLVPSGLYITNVDKTTAQDALDIGYVFNVQITNYQGEYETWFTIKNNGHLEIVPTGADKNESNVQYRINEYLEQHASEFTDQANDIDALKAFSSKCIYCNREVIYQRNCITCEDDENFKPNYIYRSVNPSDIDPNNRADTGDLGNNWSNPKGKAAEERITSLGKADAIYDDYTKENLEYEFNLSTKVMQEIKKSNKSTNYYDFGLKCNEYGKECVSSFVDDYASYTEGRNKYKYYVNGQFQSGTMKNILNGKYPDLEDCPDSLCP